MINKIHKLLKEMIDYSQKHKDYLEFLRYVHQLLGREIEQVNSLFILRLGDLFLKSTYSFDPEPQWLVRTNEVYTEDKFLRLAEIAQKEGEFNHEAHLQIKIKSAGQLVGIIWIRTAEDQKQSGEMLDEIKDFFFHICHSLYWQFQLKERLKELSCLHSLSKLSEDNELTITEFLAETVKLLPPAWQHPHFTQARIIYNGRSFATDNFSESKYKLSSQLIVNNIQAGSIEINYPEAKCNPDEYPFLKEEGNLITTITGELNMILEKKKAEEESKKLEKQLIHADRLVTLGQLSAGIAHEINEPLAGILGLAQLMEKNESLDQQAKKDLENIVSASLHAREVVKKLMLFARQMPASQSHLNLNDSVKNAVFFLESRCRKNMITLKPELAAELPEIIADPSQMHQILINLIVNALQAIPQGGTIIISTTYDDQFVFLKCSDTGTGMDKQTMAQIFNPFFTTKKVNEGTGLGLSVVHGIVYSHHGDISVESKLGRGTIFTISFPRINKVSKQ